MVREGPSLTSYYSSLEEALQTIYPAFPWEPEKFVRRQAVPSGYWEDKANIQAALDKAEEALGITKVHS